MNRTSYILSALAAVLAVTFVLQETVTRRANTIPVPAIGEDIASIRIESDDDVLTLTRSEDGWRVGEASYPGDTERIDELVTLLGELGEADVISGRGSYAEFGLADGGRGVMRFFTAEREPLAIRLGDRAAAGDRVYARINESTEVVLLPNAISGWFSTDPDEFRATEMARISEDSVERITIAGEPWEPVVITRAGAVAGNEADADSGADAPAATAGDNGAAPATVPGLESEWVATLDEPLAPGRFQNLFQELAVLRAQGFPDEDPSGEPFVTLEIERREEGPVTVSLYPPTEDQQFPVRVSSSEYAFLIPEWRARRIVAGIARYIDPWSATDEGVGAP